MTKNCFYIIKDEFFDIINDKYLKQNKGQNRPHYYCVYYKEFNWMIPLSSQVEKYAKIIEQRFNNNKSCDILHIAKLDNGKESVFLIQDIFPIKEKYIEREYMLYNKPFALTSKKLIGEIEKKAKKIINLVLSGVKLLPTQIDIKTIMEKLSS